MFNAPKFSKYIKAKDPDDFRGTYGKVRGLRGMGFFGKNNTHEAAKNAPDSLAFLLLALSVYCGVGFVVLGFGAFIELKGLLEICFF